MVICKEKENKRERALEDLKIQAIITLPLSFVGVFLLFLAPCLLKDKICNPAPFFSAYAWGFAIGYLFSDRLLHMSGWILDRSKEPNMIEGRRGILFALVSIVVGYVIGVLKAFLYVYVTGIHYTLFDILRGWGIIIGGAGFCGFLGGWAFKTKEIISHAYIQ